MTFRNLTPHMLTLTMRPFLQCSGSRPRALLSLPTSYYLLTSLLPTLQAWLKSSLGAFVGDEEPTCIVHGDYRYDRSSES